MSSNSSYTVLARKWRPKKFSEVVGQQHVLSAITNGIALGRIHSSYLFSGTRGVGKTTIARLFAKSINCLNPDDNHEPCSECEVCKAIDNSTLIDIIEVDAASNTRVESTNELIDTVNYKPVYPGIKYKVYIIDEVHMLSNSSFNALLKTLEEPPEYVKFVLCTTDPQKIPAPVVSRCLHLLLKGLEVDQISQHLEYVLTQENIKFDKQAVYDISVAANTSMRDSLSLTDQAIALGNGEVKLDVTMKMLGLLDQQIPLNLIKSLLNKDSQKVFEILDIISEKGLDWASVCKQILHYLHLIAIEQFKPSESKIYSSKDKVLVDVANNSNVILLHLIYDFFIQANKNIDFYSTSRHAIEIACLRSLAFIIDNNLSKSEIPIKSIPQSLLSSANKEITLDEVISSLNEEDGKSNIVNNTEKKVDVSIKPNELDISSLLTMKNNKVFNSINNNSIEENHKEYKNNNIVEESICKDIKSSVTYADNNVKKSLAKEDNINLILEKSLDPILDNNINKELKNDIKLDDQYLPNNINISSSDENKSWIIGDLIYEPSHDYVAKKLSSLLNKNEIYKYINSLGIDSGYLNHIYIANLSNLTDKSIDIYFNGFINENENLKKSVIDSMVNKSKEIYSKDFIVNVLDKKTDDSITINSLIKENQEHVYNDLRRNIGPEKNLLKMKEIIKSKE